MLLSLHQEECGWKVMHAPHEVQAICKEPSNHEIESSLQHIYLTTCGSQLTCLSLSLSHCHVC